MRKLYLVESDTSYASLFCYELKEHNVGQYSRDIGEGVLFNCVDREQFFGNLNHLCISFLSPQHPKIALKAPDLDAAAPVVHPAPVAVADIEDVNQVLASVAEDERGETGEADPFASSEAAAQ
jgi:hypothetical protein